MAAPFKGERVKGWKNG